MADIAAVTSIEITARDLTRGAIDSVRGGFNELRNAAGSLQGVMAGLGATLSVAAFSAAIKQAIDYADHLNDLAKQTGIAVETLGGLGYAAAQTGTSLEAIAKGSAKLATLMADAAAGGEKANRVFDAMGVSVKNADGSLKAIDESLFEIADRFEGYQDGAEKAALANQIFGERMGAQLIPLLDEGGTKLRELAEEYQKYGGITADTAARADSFNDTLAKLSMMTGALWRTVASALLPTLQTLAAMFVEARDKAGGFSAIADGVTVVVKGLAIGALAAVEAFKAVGSSIGTVIGAIVAYLRGDSLSSIWAGVKQGFGDVAESVAKAWDNMGKVVNANAATVTSGVTSMATKTRAPLVALKETAEKTKKVIDELTAAEKEYLALMKELADAEAKRVAAADQQQAALIDQLARLRDEYETIGLTREELDALTLSRLDAKIATLEQAAASRESVAGMDAETAAMYAQLQVLRQIRDQTASNQARQEIVEQANAARDAWQSAADSIGQSLTDALLRGFESGADFAKNFRDTLLNMFQTLVLRPIIQAIVMPVAGGAASMFSGGAGANPLGGGIGGGGGDFLSMLGLGNPYGSGFSLFGNTWASATSGMGPPTLAGDFSTTFGSAFSNALGGAGIGFGIGTVGAQLFGNGRNNTGMQIGGTIGGMIGSAFGPIGSIVGSVLGSAIGSLFKSGGGPKAGGFAATAGLNLGPLFAADNNRYFTPNASDAEMRKIVDTTAKTFGALYGGLGGAGGSQFGLAVGFDTDPEGTANNRAHVGAFINGRQVYNYESGDDALGRDPELLQQTLELETRRALLAGLQASDLPADIAAVLNSVSAATASTDTIDNVLQLAAALRTVTAVLDADPLDDALDAIARAGQSAYSALADTAGAFEDLIHAYDGTTDASKAIEEATVGYYNALVSVVAGIEQLRTSIGSMFDDTIRDLMLQTLDDSGKKRYYQDQISQLYGQLGTATDPADVDRITKQINEYMRAAFGLLTPEEQHGLLQQYIDFANQVQGLADQRLQAAEEQAQARADQLFTQLRETLTGAANDMKAAAAQQASAASAMQSAAQTMQAAAHTPTTIVMQSPVVNA